MYLLRDEAGHLYGWEHGKLTPLPGYEPPRSEGWLLRQSWREGRVLSQADLEKTTSRAADDIVTAAIFYHPHHEHQHSGDCSDGLIVGHADGSCMLMPVEGLLHPVEPRLQFYAGSNQRRGAIIGLMTTHHYEEWGGLLVASTSSGWLLVWSLEGREQQSTRPPADDMHVAPQYRPGWGGRGEPLLLAGLAHPQAVSHCLIEGGDGLVYSIGEDGHVCRLEADLRRLRHFNSAEKSPVTRISWSEGGRVFISYQNGRHGEWDATKWTIKPISAKEPAGSTINSYRLINAPGHGHWEPHNVLAWGGTLRLMRYHQNQPWSLTVLLDLRAMVEMHGQSSQLGDNGQQFRAFCRQLIATMLDWDNDDTLAMERGLIRPHANLSLGSLGANRNGSVKCSGPLWASSHTLTALLHLSLEILWSMQADDWQPLRHYYACELPRTWLLQGRKNRRSDSLVSRHYCQDGHWDVNLQQQQQPGSGGPRYLLPSLSVSAKYWHDQLELIKRASRAVIHLTLDHFLPADLHELVAFWSQSLPVPLSGPVTSQTADPQTPMNRSAIIMAIIAIHNPGYLSPDLQKAVAESLLALLADERRNLFRPAAIELLGLGVSLWEAHISLLSVVRLLCSSLAGQLARLEEAAPLMINGGGGRLNEQLMGISEETVCRLLGHAPISLIPSWLADINRPGRAYPERLLFIRLLNRLAQGFPLAIRPFCPAIGDALVRLLDPNLPNIRTRLLPQFTHLLPQLLASSPWWAWHGPSQRLACGSPDGPIVILDVRTGTRLQVLEGMTHAITAVAFNPDGRSVVAYSAAEAYIRWWHLATGLLGLLHVAGKPVKSFVVDPTLTEAILQNELAPVRFQWLNNQTIQITVDGQPVTVIPSI